MSTTELTRTDIAPIETTSAEETADAAVRPAPRNASAPARYAWALARISLGWIFLWAFLDKAFGLGFATERADAWVNGGSPTFGFLSFGTNGPFAAAFQSLALAGAGHTWGLGRRWENLSLVRRHPVLR